MTAAAAAANTRGSNVNNDDGKLLDLATNTIINKTEFLQAKPEVSTDTWMNLTLARYQTMQINFLLDFH